MTNTLIPIIGITKFDAEAICGEARECVGIPTVWWRDDDEKIQVWPRVSKHGSTSSWLTGSTRSGLLVSVLYFDTGEPAGVLIQ